MLLPLYGILRNDSLVLLILAQSEETVQDFIAKLQCSARVRVKSQESHHMLVSLHGKILSPQLTLSQAGIRPLDLLEVFPLQERETEKEKEKENKYDGKESQDKGLRH